MFVAVNSCNRLKSEFCSKSNSRRYRDREGFLEKSCCKFCHRFSNFSLKFCWNWTNGKIVVNALMRQCEEVVLLQVLLWISFMNVLYVLWCKMVKSCWMKRNSEEIPHFPRSRWSCLFPKIFLFISRGAIKYFYSVRSGRKIFSNFQFLSLLWL